MFVEFLKNILGYLEKPNPESLKLSLNNVHAPDLFSLVIDGTEFGHLTRVFIAKNKLKPFDVQLHTHRYPLRITAIKGKIVHHVASIPSVIEPKHFSEVTLSEWNYKSFLTGGSGLSYIREVDVKLNDYILPPGSQINMGVNDYHTVSCSPGSIWIVQECGFEAESSKMLGIPFIADSLYTTPEMFQVNDKCQIVAKEIRTIINQYQSVK